MDDLTGSARDRIDQLELVMSSAAAEPEWLARQLRAALAELAELEPIADVERERNEDF